MKWRPPLPVRLIYCFSGRWTDLTPIGALRRGAASILLNVLVNYNIHPRLWLPRSFFLCLGKSKTQPGWCNLRRGIKEQDAELDGRTRIPRETNFHIKSIEHWHLSKLSSAPHNTGVGCVFVYQTVHVSSKRSCTSLLSTLDVASASHVELLELRDTCKEVQTDRKN